MPRKEREKMLKRALHPFIVFGFILIVVFEILAVVNNFYKTVWWFDVFMHGSGGLWVAGSAFLFFGWKRPLSKRENLSILVFVANIGVLWEIFERFWDLADMSWTNFKMMGNFADTLADLGMDMAGGVLFLALAFVLDKAEQRKDAGYVH